eukprot:TRINITY_DN38455_c0_g1_i1.p1 TRINITY_DN38455_c0_g1~~TRINITY_DN38455_c0_g1_i1.p1  ORF type:complete len:397 (+),score=48.10 TRINITY_DN38455_c0_g1_i1:41-1192(+)
MASKRVAGPINPQMSRRNFSGQVGATVARPRGACGSTLRPGMAVRIFGLQSAKELNGQEGTCGEWDSISGRMHIALNSGGIKAVRPVNLRKVVQPQPEHVDPAEEHVTRVFRRYDTNGDGRIDEEELRNCLHALGMNSSFIASFLEENDTNGDGVIDYEEFVQWVMRTKPSPVFGCAGKLPGGVAESAGGDDEEVVKDRRLTIDDIKQQCHGKLPEGWPSHGLNVANNMRLRFPEYPVEGIIFMMITNEFHGGNVLQAIRKTGAKEVRTMIVGSAEKEEYVFPATYSVRLGDPPLNVYEEGCFQWSFQNLRNGKLTPKATLQPGAYFRVLELRTDSEYGFTFGLIEYDSRSGGRHWVDLGLEVDGVTSVVERTYSYTSAQRIT